ncbi:hypothetical protein DSM112329_04294 [Paraconexibacter sp. AEG42_29]|uniref:Acyl-CoA thioesterase n=1 Tax=Paraconexibacter sp. AEG42_29 TaxID=2997339 RepID=A0AAU7B0K4_9ACTN
MSDITESAAGHARITLTRRVEWIDTDAAGIYHWTTAFRFAEAAEAALHTALGIVDQTFGVTPRVAVATEFTRSLRFNDEVSVELAVERVGRTSLRYGFGIIGPQGVAVTGTLTICLVDATAGRPVPWPEETRLRLETGGPQQEVR